ncbi:MAG: AraC family transcriptional regulator [Lentisphaeria bacterium]|nr:AraC family transcriptional regulator [Lentisphaeria bacterium]
MNECFAELPHLRSFGVRLFDLFWRTHYHVDPDWEFHFIRHGHLTLEFHQGSFSAGPGDIVLIPRDTPHRDKFDPGQDYEVFMASFSWPGAETEFRKILPAPVLHDLSDDQRCRIRQYCDALYLDTLRESEFDQLLSRTIFHTLLLSILKAVSENHSKAAGNEPAASPAKKKLWLIQEVKGYIQRNFQKQITLEDLAQALSISQYHLSRVFNAESGFSLPEYLTMVRMEKAKILLSEGQKNISQVAYAVGYEDSSYFAKVFRKYFGCSPSASAMSHPVRRV